MKVEGTKINHYHSIYVEYAPMLLHFAEKFVSPFYAEDIVHDVFLKLWDKQVFRLPKSDLKKILYVSVRNACIDHLRKLNIEQNYIDKRAVLLKLEEINYFEDLDELFMQKDLLNKLLLRIEKLPPRSAQIIRLSYIEGLKAKEIAEQLDISVRSVENTLYRALKSLKNSGLMIYLFIFF